MRLASSLTLVLLSGCTCADSEPAASADEVVEAVAPETPDEPAPTVAADEPSTRPGPPTRLPAESAAEARAAIREGRRLAQQEDFVGALAAFDRALAILPGAPRVRCESGYIAHRAGQEGRAGQDLDVALALLPDPEDAPEALRVPLAMCLYNRGLVYESMGQPTDAVEVYLDSLELRPNRVVSTRLEAARAAQQLECRPPRPPVDASPRAIQARVTFDACHDSCGDDDAEDEWDDECPNDCWVELPESDAPVDGALLLSLAGEGCQVEYVGRVLAVRGGQGWYATELCGSESATTDGFYRAEATFSCEVSVRRVSPSVVLADMVQTDRERYGDTLRPPAGAAEDDPECSADHSSFSESHSLVICDVGRDPPRCGELELGAHEGGGTSVFCENTNDDELPAWAAAMDTYRDEDDDTGTDAPADAYTLTFDGDAAVLTRVSESADGPAPGRYSVDELLDLTRALELR